MAATVSAPRESQERSFPDYRRELRKVLPKQVFEPDLSSIWWFAPHAGIIAACLYVLTAHFHYGYAWLLSLIIGHSFGCLGFLAHDICHGGSVKNRRLRNLLAGVGFSPFWIGPYLWSRWHNSDHHNNTQIEGIDPDHLFTMEDYQHNPVLKLLYRLSPLARNLVIFSSFSYRMSQQTLRMVITYLRSPKSTFMDKAVILFQLILPAAIWIGVSLALGTQVFWWGYFLPLLVANAIVISYIATNHFLNPLADERDVLATSLSVTLPRGLKWLDPWHQFFGAHVSHHLFPGLSPRYSRMVEEKAAELWPDRYHAMPITTALKKLWQTPWIYEDQTTLLDPVRDERFKTLGHGMPKD